MEQLIDDSYDYLENHPEAVEHCESYIEDGYSVNKRMDEGGETVSSLLSAINSVTLSAPILVYRGLSELKTSSVSEWCARLRIRERQHCVSYMRSLLVLSVLAPFRLLLLLSRQLRE